ncbi:IS110 family transposase [Acidithiobacillus ferrivorans]|nr:IS110 family transposase [Acidithiobacillus ferrivorans]
MTVSVSKAINIFDRTHCCHAASLSQPFERFESPKQVVAYAGLNPRIRQSWQWNGKTSIAKTGNSQLRKAIYMPALTAKRFNPVVSIFCERLLAR